MPKPGSTTSRGYGAKHRTAKAKAKTQGWNGNPPVDSGYAQCAELICLMPNRTLAPDAPFDMAHDRANPGEYLGPAHIRCNRSEGATYGNRRRNGAELAPKRWNL